MCTSHSPRTGVNSNLQSQRMNLVRDICNSIGEFLTIWNEVSGRISTGRPAVIHHDIVVSEILEAQLDDTFGRI